MSDTIIAAIIGAAATLIAALIGIFVNKSLKKRTNQFLKDNSTITLLEPEQNFNHLLGKVKNISFYTVNSYELMNRVNNSLEQNPDIVIENLTIMVRKKADETKEDLDTLGNNIKIWRSWVERKRIKKLVIVAYDHDPDHYYTIIGNRVVFCGQVFFDETRPTGTRIDYLPIVFSDESAVGRQVIKNYQAHFNNVMSRYKEKATLYHSEIMKTYSV